MTTHTNPAGSGQTGSEGPGHARIASGQIVEPMLAKAFRALDRTGHPWLLLRGEDDLARPSGDVDILVAGELLQSLDSIFEAAGFCRVLAPGHGSHRFFFSYSPCDDLWVKLDVVSEVAFGPLQQWRTTLATHCLGRRVRSGLVWLPAEPDRSWLKLLHLFLDKGEVAPNRMAMAREAAQVASADESAHDWLARFVDRHMGAGAAANLLDVVRQGRFDDVPATAAMLRSSWTHQGVPPGLLALRNKLLRQLGAKVRGRGPVIGVMAPDGAGKTTLLHGLRGDIPLPTRYVYMGLWGSGPWDSWLRRVPGGRSAKKVFRIIRGGLTARFFSALGRVVLMDRVAYDALLPKAGGTERQGRITDSFAFAVVPDPDVLLVLDVSGEVMFGRKGEHSAEVLEGWRQAYRQLARSLPHSVLVNAAQPRELVQREATGIVWRLLEPDGASEIETSGPGRSAGNGAEPDKADGGALTLHLWRLLDWRFLLPGLQPKSVGYGGLIGSDVESAIHLLDPRAAAIRADAGGSERLFDVVLLAVPDRTLFRSAALAVEPGGWLCVEVRRSLLGKSAPRTLNGWKREFVRSGLEDVTVYWNAPSLDATARIVPVTSGAAIRDTLSLHKNVRFGGAKAFAARLALTLGVFDVAIPGGTIVGQKPSGRSSGDIH